MFPLPKATLQAHDAKEDICNEIGPWSAPPIDTIIQSFGTSCLCCRLVEIEDGKVIHLCSESCIAENDALLVKCYCIRSTYKSFLV